jgi:hypothetical protein
VAGDGAAVIIEHDRQPGLLGFSVLPNNPDVQFAVVGLPDGIGRVRFPAMDQIEGFRIGLGPFMG